VRAASDVVKPGQQVDVRVLEIDAEGRRISLSIKRAKQGAAPAAAATGATPAAPPAPKKPRKTPLRGGLDF
jgi:ribosomal protein S1